MHKSTPQVPEATEEAPEPMKEAAEEAAVGTGEEEAACNTRKFHHNKILLAPWFSFIF
jgi:hypothetical protein